MRSTAHIKSHPIHPILVPFPIAFLIGSFLFDLYGFVFKEPALYQTSFYMQVAGIGFAVLAAIPGLIDLNKTVPPDSSARKRGIRHGILNTLMLIIFTIAWFYRKGDNADMRILLLMEFTGSILLFIAGWMGGTLVYRNQIGV
ncbi:MAG: DUF2231 domain-containing protein, partial [Flavisolibacter sp.]|nr:DUF2231 domain-containing protein [Flavisolibacter sp.]